MASGGMRDVEDAIRENDTAFDTRVADNTVNRLDIPGTYTFNRGRHRLVINGSFIFDTSSTSKFTDLDGKWQLTASAGDELIFGSRELLRYVPNYELLWGVASWAESALQEGQRFHVEFSDDAQENGYAYTFEGTADEPTLTLKQFQGSTTPVDTVDVDLDGLRNHNFSVTEPFVCRQFVNWYGAGVGRSTLSFPTQGPDGEVDQKNPHIGSTFNADDVATNNINLRPQVRVEVDAGAPDLTVNVCSIGALVRGNATEFDREKTSVFWNLGGAISQYYTDNNAVLAGRIDPTRNNVVAKIQPPIVAPAGTTTMAVLVGAVHKDHPDLTVNFDDPDNDGTDEGPAPAAQTRAEDDVMQWTTDVTAYPTTTDIRADFTTGSVPDVRELTTAVAEGDKQTTSSTAAGELADIKRIIYPDDVVLFIPRTDPAGTTTDGTIQYLKTLTEQDR